MAKKSIWIDNTRPPTNYIWAKTDSAGNIIGVYQYNGTIWVKLASSISGGDTDEPTEADGTIEAVTITGEKVTIGYSMSALPGNIVVRKDNGTIEAAIPSGENPNEVLVVKMLSWEES